MDKAGKADSSPFHIPVTHFSWSSRPGAQTLSLPEQIANKIGSGIIQGRYQPGERIQEQELANSFGVSRGPVRDALRLLERDGFVQITARRGTYVTELTSKEIIDVFNMRSALISLAARLVAEQQDRSVIAELQDRINALDRLAETSDVDSYLAAIYELNWLLPHSSGNRYLASTMVSLTYLSLRYGRFALTTVEGRKQSSQRWRALLRAIKTGRPDEAEQLAAAMIRRSRDMAVEHLSENGLVR